jgi:ComF family protein
MWRAKERERGFNQADLVAKCMVDELPGVSRKVEIMERVRETKPMYGLKKQERLANIKGAFKIINSPTDLLGQRIILVDDVWTTGATMKECTKMLKQAGAKEVWGLALAR